MCSHKYPEEHDISWIQKDYMVVCDEYPGVYTFMQFLDGLKCCDYSNNPQDWFTFKNGIIQSHWVIFVSCLPKDMDRLEFVSKHLNYDILIVDNSNEESDDYLPF